MYVHVGTRRYKYLRVEMRRYITGEYKYVRTAKCTYVYVEILGCT